MARETFDRRRITVIAWFSENHGQVPFEARSGLASDVRCPVYEMTSIAGYLHPEDPILRVDMRGSEYVHTSDEVDLDTTRTLKRY